MSRISQVKVGAIMMHGNPRKAPGDTTDLQASTAETGQQVPVRVDEVGGSVPPRCTDKILGLGEV